MFDDYLVKKQAVQDYKILILNSGHIRFSKRGQPMILVKKWKFYLCTFFGQMGLEILFNDHWGRKQALLYYKKLDMTKLPNWDFLLVKTFCLFVFFGKIGLEIMSDDHIVKNQALSQSKVLAIERLISRFFLATNHSACINFCPQSVSQSAMQSVSQSAS